MGNGIFIPLRVLFADNPLDEYNLIRQEKHEEEQKQLLEEKKAKFESFWDQYL